ncbi:bifunctional glutamate N-acetyltransferase/amino-acid acetyltransferase ArgJ [Acetanaerobacterium elongatum]|uniref:Arginine biosynthesis bifunctional protein ArgJ n=1 Tax=Acetanaerobacterium elongatum TaxID=258515 RepID=A0A1H0G107_9FIRM|nr:bifunctional glutamate N-acetyltransferase/amino-acid acetyltransferase ArgJ [Acetanaerobacterium elongatum]SDO00514.1 glutamate N-acetyltransferase [Acetanaerobacterium elongatum]
MDSITIIEGGVTAPKGFLANGVSCGIKHCMKTGEVLLSDSSGEGVPTKRDVAVIFSMQPCTAAAVYTQNKVKGAPIAVTKRHLADGKARAVIANSGNANTCNADGEQKALQMCTMLARELNISADEVIVASTGVIGQTLPIEPIQAGIDMLVSGLSQSGGTYAAEAIMTTDTFKKEVAVTFEIGGVPCVIGGMSKGSGMIHPNMATLLAFITTDANINASLLQQALSDSVKLSYNMISVDGDTSTNDMACILANGAANNPKITEKGEDYNTFCKALNEVNIRLARLMAKDGEGATKLLECRVSGAPNEDTAKKVAKSVVCSSLFKAAMFGQDANWGRILCAIGYTDAQFNIDKTEVSLASSVGTIKVCESGAGVAFSEEEAKGLLAEDEIIIEINLHDGKASATAWGCDLTYDYVKINGDYRT